ncbi:MAG: hypothetical protein JJE01_08435 [Gemmatimonadetes bacterium]|nr:hypothetical protein [Gemmatimonadota bacterium]
MKATTRRPGAFSSLRDPWARNWLLVALVLNLAAAYFSWGFHQFDEHFQILEFANYKLGNSPASDLPWEFSIRRSGLGSSPPSSSCWRS